MTAATHNKLRVLVQSIIGIIGDLWRGLLLRLGIEEEVHKEHDCIHEVGRGLEFCFVFVLASGISFAVSHLEYQHVHLVKENIFYPAHLALFAVWDCHVLRDCKRQLALLEHHFKARQKLRTQIEICVKVDRVALLVKFLYRTAVGGDRHAGGVCTEVVAYTCGIESEVADGNVVLPQIGVNPTDKFFRISSESFYGYELIPLENAHGAVVGIGVASRHVEGGVHILIAVDRIPPKVVNHLTVDIDFLIVNRAKVSPAKDVTLRFAHSM